ncbi:hypothetical protein D1AOALGA4SA_8991 [Olavius algarvensis Delta 1 endosymbiont]|nr:hypothetical protein D1AOALGA4SA_8991 [Olavius algarvensis Delta 1 endosymbiont]
MNCAHGQLHLKFSRGIDFENFLTGSKDPGPEDPALSSPQRGGVYL